MRAMSAHGPTSSGHRAIAAVTLAWGIQAIVTQSLLLREATVLMSGSELVWGIVLSAWLAGVAGGAWIGGRIARRTGLATGGLTVALLLLGVLSCASLWGFRETRTACDIGPGELLPLSTMVLAAVVLVLPCGLMVGMAFPLAGRVRESGGLVESGVPINRIYTLESAGSLLGGALFTFWAVEHLSPIRTALLCTVLTALTLSLLLLATGSRRSGVVVLLAAGVAAATAGLAGPRLNRFLVERRWRGLPGYELVAEAESRYQNLAVIRLGDQFTLYCDGQRASDFPDPRTFAPPAHFWMCQHPEPRRVLVLGGGEQGLLAEILKHPVQRVDHVESDPRLITLIEPFRSAEDRAALQDPRVTVRHGDARLCVKMQDDPYDLVIACLPEPTSALRARFYTREFFAELRRAMTERAVLCLTATASPTSLPTASARYLAGVRDTIATRFPDVLVGWGDPAYILAATQKGLISTDAALLTKRYQQRHVESRWFDPVWFDGATDWFTPEKVRLRVAELDAAPEAAVSTDLRPIIYMHRLALWEKMTAAHSHRLIERLLAVKWWQAAAVLAVATLAVLLAYRAIGRPFGEAVVVFSVGSTGFVTMSLSIVWLFAFQNLYGYVYQWIGWIIAVFMGGLVIGCAWAGRRVPLAASVPSPGRGACPPVPAAERRRLITVDLSLAILAVLAPAILPLLARLQVSAGTLILVQAAVVILVLVTGILGGAAFALASRLHNAVSGRPTATAGAIVGADHAGACLGALATGLLMVPVFGIPVTAFLLGGVKVLSVLLLRTVRSSPGATR